MKLCSVRDRQELFEINVSLLRSGWTLVDIRPKSDHLQYKLQRLSDLKHTYATKPYGAGDCLTLLKEACASFDQRKPFGN